MNHIFCFSTAYSSLLNQVKLNPTNLLGIIKSFIVPEVYFRLSSLLQIMHQPPPTPTLSLLYLYAHLHASGATGLVCLSAKSWQ